MLQFMAYLKVHTSPAKCFIYFFKPIADGTHLANISQILCVV